MRFRLPLLLLIACCLAAFSTPAPAQDGLTECDKKRYSLREHLKQLPKECNKNGDCTMSWFMEDECALHVFRNPNMEDAKETKRLQKQAHKACFKDTKSSVMPICKMLKPIIACENGLCVVRKLVNNEG